MRRCRPCLLGFSLASNVLFSTSGLVLFIPHFLSLSLLSSVSLLPLILLNLALLLPVSLPVPVPTALRPAASPALSEPGEGCGRKKEPLELKTRIPFLRFWIYE